MDGRRNGAAMLTHGQGVRVDQGAGRIHPNAPAEHEPEKHGGELWVEVLGGPDRGIDQPLLDVAVNASAYFYQIAREGLGGVVMKDGNVFGGDGDIGDGGGRHGA